MTKEERATRRKKGKGREKRLSKRNGRKRKTPQEKREKEGRQRKGEKERAYEVAAGDTLADIGVIQGMRDIPDTREGGKDAKGVATHDTTIGVVWKQGKRRITMERGKGHQKRISGKDKERRKSRKGKKG